MEQRHGQMIWISTPKDSVERQKPAVETEQNDLLPQVNCRLQARDHTSTYKCLRGKRKSEILHWPVQLFSLSLVR